MNSGVSDSKSSVMSPMSKYKLVFLGDQSVGKTSIINRFMFDTFDGKEHPTVGIDFISKTMHYEERVVKLQLWDTAGQERFRTLIPSYIRDSAVAVVVYDITNKVSFYDLGKWIEDVRNERGNEVIICVVGNKNDLADMRQVTTEEGMLKAKELEVLFMEVSAKSGANINSLFQMIAGSLPSNENSQIMFQSAMNMSTTPNNAGNIQLSSRNQGVKNEKEGEKGRKCC